MICLPMPRSASVSTLVRSMRRAQSDRSIISIGILRRRIDGHPYTDNSGFADFMDADDALADLLRRGERARANRRGRDLHYQLPIDFADVDHGREQASDTAGWRHPRRDDSARPRRWANSPSARQRRGWYGGGRSRGCADRGGGATRPPLCARGRRHLPGIADLTFRSRAGRTDTRSDPDRRRDHDGTEGIQHRHDPALERQGCAPPRRRSRGSVRQAESGFAQRSGSRTRGIRFEVGQGKGI